MNLSCVGFDLGYTLVHTHRERIFQKVVGKLGIDRSLAVIFEAYHRTDKLFMRDFPGVMCGRREDFMPSYFTKLLETLRIDTDAKVVLAEFLSEESIFEKEEKGVWFAYKSARSVLSMLKLRGIKTILVSNWDETAETVLKQNRLSELLDGIVISSQAGVSKPDKKIFEIALSKVGVKPENSLYVGDNYYDDFVGANSAGMHFVLINHLGRVGVEEIRNIDVIPDVGDLPQYLQQYHKKEENTE